MKRKITADMSVHEARFLISDGNIRTMTVGYKMFENHKAILYLMSCDEFGIRGTRLYKFYAECCSKNIEKLYKTLDMIRDGVFTLDEVEANLNLEKAIPFIDESILIDDSNYDIDSDALEWIHFCLVQRDNFLKNLDDVYSNINQDKIKLISI